MNPPGTKDPKDQGAAAKAQPADAPDGSVADCKSCTVTVSPSPVNLCNTTKSKAVTATGSPAGGSFSWTVDDPAIAKISGSGKTVQIQGVKQGRTKIKVKYSVGCTCTDEADVRVCTCSPAPHKGRYYATGHKSVTDPIGVRAKIKARYGKVCCEDEGCSTLDSYNVVYANVSHEKGKLIWAQTGFGRERQPGTTTINKYRYAEMNGSAYKVNYDTANAPGEGSVSLYQCELNMATGTWTYSQDGADWQKYTDNAWKNQTGNSIQYTGEIIDKEDDMAGTAGDKCEITECQYLQKQKPGTEALEDVLYDFGFDQSDVTPEQQGQLDAIADKIQKSFQTPPKVLKVRLVGHTDAVGSAGYNIGLGQRRALAVKGALADALEARESGLSGKVKWATESKGESQLIDHSGTPAGDARNRRVEVFLTTDSPDNDWKDAGLTAGEVRSDDNGEWGAEWVSGTALNIWDKQPLP